MLSALIGWLRAGHKYHELFEILLMQERVRLGLPVALMAPIDELPEPTRSRLEEAYLAICREIGMQLLSEGRVHEAWPYLRPLGDRQLVSAGLAKIEPSADNVQPLIEILLHEGIDVGRGYQLVLDHYGTCNAITAFENIVLTKSRTDQQDAAVRLVRHLHEELSDNLKADIEHREGQPPAETTLRAMIAARPHLFAGDAYHIDITHLAATLRHARLLEAPAAIALALDLAEYSDQVSRDLWGAGEPPFAEAGSHALFLAAQLGQHIPEALAYFRQRAEQVDTYREGTLAAEVYVVLLARVGRPAEAIDAAARLIPPGTHTTGFAPSLMELSAQSGDYTRLIDLCQTSDNVVAYTAALLADRTRNLSECRSQREGQAPRRAGAHKASQHEPAPGSTRTGNKPKRENEG